VAHPEDGQLHASGVPSSTPQELCTTVVVGHMPPYVHMMSKVVLFKTVCGFTQGECDAIVDLSLACVQSGVDPLMAQAHAPLPLGHHTVPAQSGSRGKRGAVGEISKAKQEQCVRTVR